MYIYTYIFLNHGTNPTRYPRRLQHTLHAWLEVLATQIENECPNECFHSGCLFRKHRCCLDCWHVCHSCHPHLRHPPSFVCLMFLAEVTDIRAFFLAWMRHRVSAKNAPPKKKDSWADRLPKRQIGGWRAVSAEGLQGKGSRSWNCKRTGMSLDTNQESWRKTVFVDIMCYLLGLSHDTVRTISCLRFRTFQSRVLTNIKLVDDP